MLHIFLVAFLFHKRKELPSVSCIEAAEDLIILQTEYLDTYDQSLHSADKEIAQDNNDPVRGSALCGSGKHHYNLHHSCVAYGKGADTQERKSVGKIA